MLFSFFLVCAVALVAVTVLLVLIGSRVRFASRIGGVSLAVAVYFAAGWFAAEVWRLPPAPTEADEVYCLLIAVAIVLVRPEWNPIGQVFMATFAAAASTYLLFALSVTFAGNLSPIGALASLLLFVLEFIALALASSFAFETCDVICRVRHSRNFPQPDPNYRPMVSLHIAAYNEPPDMLIETIKRAEALEYPNFEIVVVDNNTKDPAVWQPVEDYCSTNARIKFVHVDPWPGYKSGALNLALRQLADPAAEIVGVIDADYLVDPQWLDQTVGYFADPDLAFVQTPQDYRDYEGSSYLTACYDAYRYFFATAMPSRNERNSIIFAGTMGLLRTRLLQSVDGWDEWCITEDADTSLRLLRAGYSGLFLGRSFGKGIMPLTFSSLKSQRFRWCFGGMQILRQHWKSLMPWDRSRANHLSIAQRLDYLVGGLQWLNDFVYLCFTAVLLLVAGLLLAGDTVAVRPLIGPTILLPATLLASGLTRAVWALRQRTGITYRRALLAFVNWLSLSWTVALACAQGLLRREGVFLRTPKEADRHSLRAALQAARAETLLFVVLWAVAILLGFLAHPTWLLVTLVSWQGLVYLAAPFTSWLAQRTQLSPELERRRQSESARERFVAVIKPVAVPSALAGGVVACALLAILGFGSTHAGKPANPFAVPPQNGSGAPWGVVPVSTTSNASQTPAGPKPAGTTTTTTTTVNRSTTTSVPASSTTTTSGQGTTTTSTSLPATTTTGASSTTTTTAATTTTTTTTPATTTSTTAG
jgi:cellulose synthase/poly-beta-1,6-N-acetylglucosamine synthase-like glycosyltransferase